MFNPRPSGKTVALKKVTMKKNYQPVPTRFAPETRFEVKPVPTVPFRGTQETELERLKAELLKQHLNETTDAPTNARWRRAANDAATLAWLTPFPLLFFPALLEEKARQAERQAAHQLAVLKRCQNSVGRAA